MTVVREPGPARIGVAIGMTANVSNDGEISSFFAEEVSLAPRGSLESASWSATNSLDSAWEES